MKILVTGGNGFIGSHLCESLVNKGFSVICLDQLFNQNTAHIDCKKIIADVTESAIINDIVRQVNVIIHLAAVSRVEIAQREPLKCFKVNIMGLTRILEALKNNPKTIILFGSSREVYGEPISLPVTETHPKKPISIYGLSKLACEDLLSLYNKLFGLRYIILRFSNVYGSIRDIPERVIPKFAQLAIKELPLPVNGGGQVLDFTFIDDVTSGIVRLVEKLVADPFSCTNEDYHLTTCIGTSILDLAAKIKKTFNSNSPIEVRPSRNFDVNRFIGDYGKANRVFSYNPKYSLDEGLAKYKKDVICI